MIEQMKRRFLIVSMGSFTTVMLILFVVLNVANYLQTMGRQEQSAIEFVETQLQQSTEPPKEIPNDGEQAPDDDEKVQTDLFFNIRTIFGVEGEKNKPNTMRRYMDLFYTIYDVNGEVVKVVPSFDEDMTVAEVQEQTDAIYYSKKYRGWSGYDRFVRHRLSDGRTAIIFVDTYREADVLLQLLWISIAIFAILLIGVYTLLRFFSSRAIQPLIRNIERQKEFISNASHEIKTPLAVLSTNNDVMEMIGMQNEWTQSNRKQIHRLNELIEQMLLLARFDEGKGFIKKGPMNVTEVVDNVVEELRSLLLERGYDLQSNLPDQILVVSDEESVRQLVISILGNAIKYHTGEEAISIDWNPAKKELCIANSCDTMTEAELSQLFDRFYRRDTARNRDEGGSGMGLSIARAIAKSIDIQLVAELINPTKIVFKMQFE